MVESQANSWTAYSRSQIGLRYEYEFVWQISKHVITATCLSKKKKKTNVIVYQDKPHCEVFSVGTIFFHS